MSEPILVRIKSLAEGPPLIEAVGAPQGYNIYVGPLINNPAVEEGALINLFGVDHGGAISDQGWRFLDPSMAPDANLNALGILWITHDHAGPFASGDLQIGFNRARPGRHYANPIHTHDQNLGPATNRWVTVYADDTLVVRLKSAKPGHKTLKKPLTS